MPGGQQPSHKASAGPSVVVARNERIVSGAVPAYTPNENPPWPKTDQCQTLTALTTT